MLNKLPVSDTVTPPFYVACFNLQVKFGKVTFEDFLRAFSELRTGEVSGQWLLELCRWRLLRTERT